MESVVSETAHTIRILVVDDHPLLRDGVAAVVGGEADMTLVGQAASGEQAVEMFRRLHPDVTLMDLKMPGMKGIEAMREIRSGSPRARIIVLTTYPGDAQATQALKGGADGFLLKTMLRKDLLDAIRAVHAGRRIVPDEVASQIAQHMHEQDLSEREIEVLRNVAQGMANKVVGAKLGITEETVKAHMKNIMGKLSARDRAHAVSIATNRGILG
jgi:DNA-binding NarL/FixJ family response regulator